MLLTPHRSTRAVPIPVQKRETQDLKCPRCTKILYLGFYESYRAAPWATMHTHRTCDCGYKTAL